MNEIMEKRLKRLEKELDKKNCSEWQKPILDEEIKDLKEYLK